LTTRPLDHSTTYRRRLVRLGQLAFDDLLLLDPAGLRLALQRIDAAGAREDLLLALNNTPRELVALRRACPGEDFPFRTGPIDDIHAAQSRIVELLALDLLVPKAPPLFDALPWLEWDWTPVQRRFQPWRTRHLIAGDGASVALQRLRKTAGVAALEPRPPLAQYIEKKAALENTRRFRLLPASLDHLTTGPLPQVDLALLGSFSFLLNPPSAQSAVCSLQSAVCSVSACIRPDYLAPFLGIPSILIVENSPLLPPLDPAAMTALGFRPDQIEVRSLGPRPCWWRG
jgi:hypothetical protein